MFDHAVNTMKENLQFFCNFGNLYDRHIRKYILFKNLLLSTGKAERKFNHGTIITILT